MILAVGVQILAPTKATAFCRTTTISVPADYIPPLGGCWTEGLPLYWKNECIGYDIHKDASRQVPYSEAVSQIANAFGKWSGAACANAGMGFSADSRPSVATHDMGPVECGEVRYNMNAPNQHVIVFRDDEWPYNDSSNTLGLTTVTFDTQTGEIYDADVELNTHDYGITLHDPVPQRGYDFASIVTHEMGHFLGLAHSPMVHTTMTTLYPVGETWMRELSNDDISAICTIYKPNGSRERASSLPPISKSECDPTPRHGFSSKCLAPSVEKISSTTTSGCSPCAVVPIGSRVNNSSLRAFAFACSFLLIGGIWRRRG